MSVDWDRFLLAPVMAVFGEDLLSASTLPRYMPAAPGAAAFDLVDAVFDREFQEIVMIDEVPNATMRPVLGVRLALFAAPPVQNDKVFIPSVGVTYIVREVRPDGHGWAKLMLNMVPS
jgi:hypothetical protein